MFQNEEKNDTLTEAKDKAQIAATTAMLVIHIGLLVDTIERGPTQIRFHTARIVLISIAIALQIAAGLTALIIANVRKYFRKHKAGCCTELSDSCLCQSEAEAINEREIHKKVDKLKTAALAGKWDFITIDREEAQRNPSGNGGSSSRDTRSPNSVCCCWNRTVKPSDEESTIGESNSGYSPSRCCCLNKPTRLSYEDQILQNHEAWMELSVLEQLSSVEPQKKWDLWNRRVEKNKSSIKTVESKWKRLKKKYAGEHVAEVVHQKRAQLEARKESQKKTQNVALEKRQYYAKILRNQSIFRTQGKILGKYAIAIRKNRVLKCISVWQHGINYMLYAVFILNALIVGFGSMSSSDSSDSDCIEECVCPTLPPQIL